MSDLLIFTTAEGRYKVYTDLFTTVCKRAYPQYDVRVMETHTVKQYGSACMRFLFPVAPGYKYIYITDIDMMICPETPSLLDFHLAEIMETGLCYSNVPRWKEPMGENRMTGLHFVTEEWWGVTHEARAKETIRLVNGEIGSCKCDDELLLMRIVRASGLRVTDRKHLISRHHGIHLGTLRDYRQFSYQKRRANVYKRLKGDKARFWVEFVETEEYRSLFSAIRKADEQAKWELEELEKFARQIAK